MNIQVAATIVVAFTGFLVTYLVNLRLARRKDRLERVNEQLRDLYGPLLALVEAANSAWTVFRTRYRPEIGYWDQSAPPTGVDAEAWRIWIKSAFMPLNRRMQELVVTKAHLIDGSRMPQCLLDLSAHVSAYEPILAQWEAGNFADNKPILPFPRIALQEYAEAEFVKLKTEQQQLLATRRLAKGVKNAA